MTLFHQYHCIRGRGAVYFNSVVIDARGEVGTVERAEAISPAEFYVYAEKFPDLMVPVQRYLDCGYHTLRVVAA